MAPISDRSIQYRSHQGFIHGSFTAMAGPCEIIVESQDRELAKKLTELAATEAWRIETTYSRYRHDNLIHKINHAQGKPIEVDREMAAMLDFADNCYQISEGLFDITSGVLGKLWKFDGSCNIPNPQSVSELVSLIGWDKAKWQNPVLTLPKGMAIDFGGFGKEFAVDSVTNIIKQQTDNPTLVNFGGDIAATRAPKQRAAWYIGIDEILLAENRSNIAPRIRLKQGAIATSGDSKRYLLDEGKVLSHVLNPKTGWPIEDAPASVTVLAETCTQAGLFSTLAMLQGKNAETFLESQDIVHWIQRR